MAYNRFAKVYDIFMNDIPYGEWAEYVINRLKSCGINPLKSKLLELGCGTGNMAKFFCMEGMHVTGIDLSEQMVKVANNKLIPNFMAYTHDMRVPFGKKEEYDVVVSLCDSMNYLADKTDMQLTFKAANRELKKDGIFLFDLKTDDFFRNELGDGIFADNRKNLSYIWENHYDEKKHINIYDITFFVKFLKFGKRGLYYSFKEHHVQRAYRTEYIINLAKQNGFELLEKEEKNERIYYILKKK